MSGLSHDWNPVDSARFEELRILWPEHKQDVFRISEAWGAQQAAVTFEIQIPVEHLDAYFQMSKVTYVAWRHRGNPIRTRETPGTP